MTSRSAEPKYGYCPQCFRPVHNRGAHAEACPGPMVLAGFQCERCLRVYETGPSFCSCGGMVNSFYKREPA